MNYGFGSLLAFVGVIAMIPLALWLLKRTPMGAGMVQGPMRLVATLPLSPQQRLLTVEVGQGDDRRWLVLGVSAAGIATLHTMAPQAVPEAASATATAPFAQWLQRARGAGSQPHPHPSPLPPAGEGDEGAR